MNGSEGNERFGVLYVDDEESSLKYFRLAYEKDFPVLTATSVPEARSLLQADSPPVAVLISDQRMPGENGTELLAEVRRTRPEIIRILTTAYSDLESAIEAVNAGEVYRYVVKPWDTGGLGATLMHAMELFMLRRERDMLLREKLSMRQRMVLSDRLRSLGAFAAALEPALPGALAGFAASLRLLPEDALAAQQDVLVVPNLAAMAEGARRESVRSLRLIEQFSARVDWPNAARTEEPAVSELVAQAVRRATERHGGAASVQSVLPPRLPLVKASAHLCVEALSSLLSFALAAAKEPPTVSASGDGGVVSVRVGIVPDATANALSLTHARAPVLELVFASLLAHHLRGSITANTGDPSKWELVFTWPVDASNAPPKVADDGALGRALDLEDLAS